MPAGAILLLGGRSSRMGAPKADLDWRGTPLSLHMATLLDLAVDGPVVAVAQPDAPAPALPPGVELVRDAAPDQGPLRGLEAGLAALEGRADRVVAAAVDLPLLAPALVRGLLDVLDDAGIDAAVPVVDGRRQPLAAAYRTTVLATARDLLAGGERSVTALTDAVRVRLLDEAALRALPGVAAADPDLRSLAGANTPEEWARLSTGS